LKGCEQGRREANSKADCITNLPSILNNKKRFASPFGGHT
jgi:hypothetical protein